MTNRNLDLEIIQSLPSLYPLQDFEEEAILNIVNGVEPKKEPNKYDDMDDRFDYEYSCPYCNADLYDEQPFCKKCGCKIKWE